MRYKESGYGVCEFWNDGAASCVCSREFFSINFHCFQLVIES